MDEWVERLWLAFVVAFFIFCFVMVMIKVLS